MTARVKTSLAAYIKLIAGQVLPLRAWPRKADAIGLLTGEGAEAVKSVMTASRERAARLERTGKERCGATTGRRDRAVRP